MRKNVKRTVFLILVQFMHLDPDQATQINADPDPKPLPTGRHLPDTLRRST
jgi:hypothetical protein